MVFVFHQSSHQNRDFIKTELNTMKAHLKKHNSPHGTFWITLSQPSQLCVGTLQKFLNVTFYITVKTVTLDHSYFLHPRVQNTLHHSQYTYCWVKDACSSLKSQGFELLNKLLHRKSMFELHHKQLKVTFKYGTRKGL